MMIRDLHEQLTQAAERAARLAKLRRQAAQLEEEHQQAAARAQALSRTVTEEERDVERLEESSLSSLLASLMGNREEKLLKERQEAEAARLKLDEAQVRQQRLETELEQVRQSIAELSGAEETYKALLAQKEQVMLQTDSEGARKLLQLGELEQQRNWQVKELQEAQRAGQEADRALADVESSLSSAQNWSTWDMFGGGWIAGAGKHASMDEARNHLYMAQETLSRFRRELRDVQTSLEMPTMLELDSFTRFADYFFDGLLIDISIHSQISESLSSVRRSREQVGKTLTWLDQKMSEQDAERMRLLAQREQFVQQYQP